MIRYCLAQNALFSLLYLGIRTLYPHIVCISQPDFEEQKYLIERQLKPEACRDTIIYFEDNKLVPTSMIDISDGLSSELFHICQNSGLGNAISPLSSLNHPFRIATLGLIGEP